MVSLVALAVMKSQATDVTVPDRTKSCAFLRGFKTQSLPIYSNSYAMHGNSDKVVSYVYHMWTYDVIEPGSRVYDVLRRLNGHDGWEVRKTTNELFDATATHCQNASADWRIDMRHVGGKSTQIWATYLGVPISKKVEYHPKVGKFGIPISDGPFSESPVEVSPESMSAKAPFPFLLPHSWPNGYKLDHAWINRLTKLSDDQVHPLPIFCLVAKDSGGHSIHLLECQDQSLKEVYPPLHAPPGSKLSPTEEHDRMMPFFWIGDCLKQAIPDWTPPRSQEFYLDTTRGVSYLMISNQPDRLDAYEPTILAAPIVTPNKP